MQKVTSDKGLLRVALVSDVPVGSARIVEIEGRRPIALFNVDGTLYATDNDCLHSGGPLGNGTLEGCIVTCPWHEWQFDVTSGACQGVTMTGSLRTYPVTVEGDAVLVDLG